MKTEIINAFVGGFVIGIIVNRVYTYLCLWLKNKRLYKPGTGKIFTTNGPIFGVTAVNEFLNENIPHKFYRYLGLIEIKESNKTTKKFHKIEYW